MTDPPEGPTAHVLERFGLLEVPRRLPGGQGTSWKVGHAVLKRADGEVTRWLSGLLRRLDGRADFRVSPPLAACDGSWSVHGWTAWRYEPGHTRGGGAREVLAVADLFHTAVGGEARPALIVERTDAWAVADRVAWAEQPPPAELLTSRVARQLLSARQSAPGRAQLVHGDLFGNVLFHPTAPPLVIDVSPYWRPPPFASAVVVVDALARGEELDVQTCAAETASFLPRALLFRVAADLLRQPGQDPDHVLHRHGRLLDLPELARRLRPG